MTNNYVRPLIDVDEDSVAQTAYDLVSARVPGWQPSQQSLDTAILEAAARLAAELRSLVADVPDDIFAGLGTIINYLPIPATSAILTAQFTLGTAAPTGGSLIPAGTALAGSAADGSLVAFETTADLTIAAAATTGSQTAAAVIPGTAANGITGAAVMIDALPQVASVTITTPAFGGIDAESDEAYLDRFARRMQRIGVQLILPADFANEAMDYPGVFRALAVDGYDPVGNTTSNLRTIAVFLQGSDGQPVSSGIKTAVDAILQSHREVNFVVTTNDPLITTINVATTVVKAASAVSADVNAAVTAAVNAFLAPATWGGPHIEGDAAWSDKHIVYIDELRSAIYQVPGVVRVSALTINTLTTDITLSGGRPHGIPQPGTVAVTVT